MPIDLSIDMNLSDKHNSTEIFLEYAPVFAEILERPLSWVYEWTSFDGSKITNDWKCGNFLLERWNSSSKDEKAEAELYSDPLFTLGCFNTYIYWSRAYVQRFESLFETAQKLSNNVFNDVETVVDFGAGIGLSTLHIAHLFKKLGLKAKVVYQNCASATLQTKLASRFFEGEDIEVCSRDEIPPADVYFISEVMEHMRKPVQFVQELLSKNDPKVVMHASSFTQPNFCGHFTEYNVARLGEQDNVVKGTQVQRHVNRCFYENKNYINVEHKALWNHRPLTLFKRDLLEVPREHMLNTVSWDSRWCPEWVKEKLVA